MEIDEEIGKSFLKKIKQAISLEEENFKKIYEEVKPSLLQCLKFVQSELGNNILMLDKRILENSEKAVKFGITFSTSKNIIRQVIEVSHSEVLPASIEIFTAEEFVDKINSMIFLVSLAQQLLGFLCLRNSNSGNNYCV
jgi:hypothetical protein